MNILILLIPISLGLGALGLGAFFWSIKNDQYDDPKGHSMRILSDQYDDTPKDD
ncbi:MAG: cbb3-type cytochrome oxidase assembly protein CcoS [Rhodobacteraceae bacterium]|nr:cbb3-type cytochrome oxidase assembly protein CcoS [Paracoccaceae bacterium]